MRMCGGGTDYWRALKSCGYITAAFFLAQFSARFRFCMPSPG